MTATDPITANRSPFNFVDTSKLSKKKNSFLVDSYVNEPLIDISKNKKIDLLIKIIFLPTKVYLTTREIKDLEDNEIIPDTEYGYHGIYKCYTINEYFHIARASLMYRKSEDTSTYKALDLEKIHSYMANNFEKRVNSDDVEKILFSPNGFNSLRLFLKKHGAV